MAITTTTITIDPALLTTTTYLSVLCASGCKDTITIDPTLPPTPTYNRVLVVGNGITYQGPIALLDWSGGRGMAASAGNKDYLFYLRTRLANQNPNVDVRELRDFPGLSATEGAYWEQNYTSYTLNRLADVKAWNPDLIILRLGENVVESQITANNFQQKYTDLVKYLKGNSTTVILTTAVWNMGVLSSLIRQIAGQNNWGLADFAPMWTTAAYYGTSGYESIGLNQYPNDAGHLEIANRIWNVIAPTVNNPSAPQSMEGGFAQGTFTELLQFAPFIPDTNQESSWGANSVQLITNGTLEYGILKSIGGIGYWLAEVSTGENLINTYKLAGSDGTKTQGGNHPLGPDTGRSMYGHSFYGTPDQQYIRSGQNTKFYCNPTNGNPCDDTGMNQNPGGSRFGNLPPYTDRSQILFFQRKEVEGKGDVLYVKTPGKQWSMNGVEAEIMHHTWWWLEGRVVKCFHITENNRPATDGQKWYGREQEAPGIYPIAPLNAHYVYKGNAPFTGGAPTRFDQFEFNGGGSSQAKRSYSTEHWVGAERPGGGTGIYIFTPYNSRFANNQFLSLFGDMNSNAASYISSALMMDGDSPATVAMQSYFYVGSRTQFRTWLNGENIPLRPLKFNFAGGKLQGCYGSDAPVRIQNGRVVWYNGTRTTDINSQVTQSKGKFIFPSVAWKASTIQKIYVNMAVTGVSQLTLSWMQVGQENETYYSGFNNPDGSPINISVANRQRINVNVIGDGQFRTYEIAVTDSPYWENYIQLLEFSNVYKNYQLPLLSGSEKVEFNWINTQPVAP